MLFCPISRSIGKSFCSPSQIPPPCPIQLTAKSYKISRDDRKHNRQARQSRRFLLPLEDTFLT